MLNEAENCIQLIGDREEKKMMKKRKRREENIK